MADNTQLDWIHIDNRNVKVGDISKRSGWANGEPGDSNVVVCIFPFKTCRKREAYTCLKIRSFQVMLMLTCGPTTKIWVSSCFVFELKKCNSAPMVQLNWLILILQIACKREKVHYCIYWQEHLFIPYHCDTNNENVRNQIKLKHQRWHKRQKEGLPWLMTGSLCLKRKQKKTKILKQIMHSNKVIYSLSCYRTMYWLY